MRLLTFAAALAVVASLAATSIVSADVPQDGRLLVTADFVMPGEELPLVGIDLPPGSVEVSLAAGGTTATLGTGQVAGDGNLSVSLPVPATFPHGYAQVVASGTEGRWEATVLIGPRAEGPGATPPAQPLDERTIGLAALGIGLLVFVAAGLAFLRGGARRSNSPD